MLNNQLDDLTLTKPSIEQIKCLAKLQQLEISAEDLPQVQQHMAIITEHAERIMQFSLPDELEPITEFRP
jgi:Asp-tRNA(Asn)/Glu-tRNA(Gln) amidotransferase C subunit